MTKRLLQLALAPLLFGTVHADEISDFRNANMLWSDNEEFHRINISQAEEIIDYRNANMLWSDNKEFHRMDAAQADDLINSNMLWSDDEEFQEH